MKIPWINLFVSLVILVALGLGVLFVVGLIWGDDIAFSLR